jgi:hypothetical protein
MLPRSLSAAYAGRPRSLSHDSGIPQRPVRRYPASTQSAGMPLPIRIDSRHPADITQPRATVRDHHRYATLSEFRPAALHPYAREAANAPPPSYYAATASVLPEYVAADIVDESHLPAPSGPGMRMRETYLNPAYLIDEVEQIEESSDYTATLPSARSAPESLTRTVRAAWLSTEPLQGFYGAEFSHALEGTGRRLARLEGSTLRDALEANFRVLGASAFNGTAVRALRDVLSLLVSIPITVGVSVQIVIDAVSGKMKFDSFATANVPFGSVPASYGLMCAELLKGPLTAALSYQTIARHHMVDDYLTRTECTLKLANAALNQLGAEGSTLRPHISLTRHTAMACCGIGEMARHASTVFTLLNYLIAPVRMGLFVNNEMIGTKPAGRPDWMDPLVGLLRFASSMSDTARAMLSQIGTQARHERFTLRMAALLDSADCLALRIRAAQSDPETRDRVEIMLKQLRKLCSMSTNPVLSLLAHDPAALDAALKSSRIRDLARISRNLEPFGIHVSRPSDREGRHLYLQPKQNHWGKVSGRDASWWEHAQLPLRVIYRLTLTLQHRLASMIHQLIEPCKPQLLRWAQRH